MDPSGERHFVTAEVRAESAPANSVSHREYVEIERARIFFENTRGSISGALMCAGMIAVILTHAGVAQAVTAAWVLAASLLSLASIGYSSRVLRTGLDAANHRSATRTRTVLGLSALLTFGLAVWLLPSTASPAEEALILLVVLAMTAIAAFVFGAVMPVYHVAATVFLLMPFALYAAARHLAQGESLYLFMAAFTFVAQVIVPLYARRIMKTSLRAIDLNYRLMREVAEHTSAREAIRHLALHDVVTGLPNRRYFEEELARTIHTAERSRARFGLLAIDLIDFKKVNDRNGHRMGDALLKAVGERLAERVRAGDFCARVGGDEFSVLVKNIDSAADAEKVSTVLRQALALPFETEGVTSSIGGSIGVAVYPEDGRTADELIARADARMYADKLASGGGR